MKRINTRNEPRLCPQCFIELKFESKQLGNKTQWWVCPDCGLRERPKSLSYSNNKNYDLKLMDKNNFKKEIEKFLDES